MDLSTLLVDTISEKLYVPTPNILNILPGTVLEDMGPLKVEASIIVNSTELTPIDTQNNIIDKATYFHNWNPSFLTQLRLRAMGKYPIKVVGYARGNEAVLFNGKSYLDIAPGTTSEFVNNYQMLYVRKLEIVIEANTFKFTLYRRSV